MRLLPVIILSMSLAACSGQPLSPTARSLESVLTTPSPTWVGTTQASDGPTGSVTATFDPTSSSVTWTGVTGTYLGVFAPTNPVAHFTVNIVGRSPAAFCSYAIEADVAHGVMTGTYNINHNQATSANGPCPDTSGHGTFKLVQSGNLN